MSDAILYDSIVIGAGPAGLTAGIYLSRSRARTLILNDGVIGGQMILTHEIANYPGVLSISGYMLSENMRKQAISFGCEIISNAQVRDLDLEDRDKKVTLIDGRTFRSRTVILAPGGRSRTLGVPGEDEFKGRGISYCATCDGDFFTGKEIIVVGGGNSALEEAVSLTKYATKVTIVHQFDHFQAYEHAIREAKEHPKIRFILKSVVSAFHGTEKLAVAELTNLKSGEKYSYPTDGAFIFIGYVPNTEFLGEKIHLNKNREIETDSSLATSIPGVFAAGDCIAKRYRQVTTAVSDGTIAALSALEFLNRKN
jgi:thioredoxin reductase (NADPH)